MQQSYLLSVVIPTKNRQEYIKYAISQIIGLECDKIQIVVQDNSSTDELDLFIKSLNNPHVKYNYNKEILSFVDNFDKAVSLSNGEYVCVIGDDDGILKSIVDIAEWASEYGVDAIIPSVNCVYIWPAETEFVPNAKNGYLCMSYTGESALTVNLDDEIKKVFNMGGQMYLSTKAVKLYHGVVKKECLDLVKKKTGKYFGGLTPDIYASVVLSKIAKKAVYINFPITISGISPKSGASDSVTGRHTGKFEDAPHLLGQTDYVWSFEVPKFYSVETIWADTAIHGLKDISEQDSDIRFNISSLCFFCWNKYPQFRGNIVSHMKKNNISKLDLIKPFVLYELMPFFKKVIRRILRRKFDVIKDFNVSNIKDAEKLIYRNLENKGIYIENVIKNLDEVLHIEN